MKDDAVAGGVLAERDCKKVRDQTEVVLEETSWWPDAICVRPIGQPDCGWTLPGSVTSALCKPTYSGAEMTCVPRQHPDNPQRPWSFSYSGK